MTETSPVYKNLSEIVTQLEWCGYECEAGPLTHNTAFIALKEKAEQGEIVPEPLQLHIKNQLGDNLAIEFCCGADKECVLQPDQEINIEIEDHVCLYLDGVKPAKTETPFRLAMEHVGGEAKMLEMICKRLGQMRNACPPNHSDNVCPSSTTCDDCWMGYWMSYFRENAPEAEGSDT